MQFKISLQLLYPGQMLPLSYQYELSAWIYGRISSADSDFGEFLHSEGYIRGSKKFKLFTFSNLWIPGEYEILDDRMKIYSQEISFVMSFLVPRAAEEMITGLFREQEFALGDRISRVDLRVLRIEAMQVQTFSPNPLSFRTTSPMLVIKPEIRNGGKLWPRYLSPMEEDYSQYFFSNLREKHATAYEHGLAAAIPENPELHFRLLSPKPKKNGIRIKAFTPEETKVIGYIFDFEIVAPAELIRVGFFAGFGGENALGFGAARLM
ncbi:MAG: CRISPR-associated endoribonuclease Cas6 [Bacteroidia bacterium]|nr:CRISPR-associated endoribonuclease Cas6 [Bacteroidia bacterium]